MPVCTGRMGARPSAAIFKGVLAPLLRAIFCLHTSARRRSVRWHQRGMDKACCDTLRMMITLAMGWVLLISSHDMLRVCVCGHGWSCLDDHTSHDLGTWLVQHLLG